MRFDTHSHGVDDDDLSDAGGAQDSVVDISHAAVHQRCHDARHSLLGMVSLESVVTIVLVDNVANMVSKSVQVMVNTRVSSRDGDKAENVRLLPQQ